MPEKKKYQGSCHCGAVRFEATTDLGMIANCNCSICSRAGYLLTFVGEDQFQLTSGQSAQTDYQFGKKHIHHLFCTTCGVRCFGHGKDKEGKTTYAVNVRCLEGVDLATLTLTAFDGKSL